MVKRLLYLAVGALALTACTSEEVLEDVASSRNAIQFETVVGKHSRATDLNLGNLIHFNVFGFYTLPENALHANAVFTNTGVNNNGNGVWTCDSVRYWVPGAKYYFYAYSCGSAKLAENKYGKFDLDMANNGGENGKGVPASKRVLEIDGYLCDYTHQHDLVVAANTGVDFAGIEGGNSVGSVGLEFKHILSKVKAKFTTSMSPEYSVEISKVIISNICNTGDYNYTKGWLNVDRVAETAPIVYLLDTDGVVAKPKDEALLVKNEMVTSGETQVQSSVETQEAYVIPFDYETDEIKDVSLTFLVQVKIGSELVIKDLPMTATFTPNWEKGVFYVYNVNIRPEDLKLGQISFTTSIESWPDPTDLGNSGNLTID